MSTIKADTIVASDGSSPVTLTKQEAAKAWVNYDNSGTVSTRDSFNISGLTDNAAGDTSPAYTNAFSNINYATASTCSLSDGTDDNNLGLISPRRAAYAQTTSDVRMHHIYNTAAGATALTDSQLNTIIFIGDLA